MWWPGMEYRWSLRRNPRTRKVMEIIRSSKAREGDMRPGKVADQARHGNPHDDGEGSLALPVANQ